MARRCCAPSCYAGVHCPHRCPDSAAPTDPLTGQELQYPGERTTAVVIDNAASSTTQWGIGSASVVLEALTESGQPTSLYWLILRYRLCQPSAQ